MKSTAEIVAAADRVRNQNITAVGVISVAGIVFAWGADALTVAITGFVWSTLMAIGAILIWRKR